MNVSYSHTLAKLRQAITMGLVVVLCIAWVLRPTEVFAKDSGGHISHWPVIAAVVAVGVVLWHVLDIRPKPVLDRWRDHTRAVAFVKAHPKLSVRYREAILKHELVIGMTRDMVIASWGEPDQADRWPATWGIRERWCYRSDREVAVLDLVNGRLVMYGYE